MSLQIGDWVRVKDGCTAYYYTVEDSIGVVIGLSHNTARVDFKEFGPTATAIPDTKEFSLYTDHLEKIDPPAHLVGVGQIVIPPQETTRAKTREEKIEIFSRKIDSEEKLVECLVECGMSSDFFNMAWYVVRDNVRVNLGYFKKIAIPCSLLDQDAYLHVSKCGTKVAFYENEDKQKRDICTVMGYGRYLTKYHPELDNEQIKAAVNTFNYDHGAAPEVFFGESQDEFIRAINEGPSESCMQGLDFAGHVHPAAVYAAGDIKVAWLERDDRITARTLINKQTKAFSRVYGDEAKLKPLLEALGYESEVGALVGCRLLKMENENGKGYIMPYVDAGVGTGGGALRFYEDGSYFMLSDAKGISTCVGNDNSGVTESQHQFACEDCGCDCDEDDLIYTHDEYSVCEECLGENYRHAIVGRDHREYVRNRDVTYVHCMRDYVHDDYLGELGIMCDDFSGEYIYSDDAVQVIGGEYTHQNNCIKCGTDKHGNTLYLHDSEVEGATAHGELYKKGDDYFWHESVEVREWLESVDDEDHDPDEFVLVETKKVEPKEALAGPTKIKAGDMVKVLENYGYGPVGHVGRVLEVSSGSVNVETPDGKIRIGEGRGWYHRIEDVVLVRSEQTAWQAAYLRMQERGIKFLHCGTFTGDRAFDCPQRGYKIDPAQVPPEGWQEIYKEAQDNGVVFDCRGIDAEWSMLHIRWDFDCRFDQYRLKEIA